MSQKLPPSLVVQVQGSHPWLLHIKDDEGLSPGTDPRTLLIVVELPSLVLDGGKPTAIDDRNRERIGEPAMLCGMGTRNKGALG